MAAREGSDNPEWIKCKKIVDMRDHNMCRCCKILTPGEMMAFRKSRPGPRGELQHAHREPVSLHPEKAHDPMNVVLMCPEHHRRIDTFHDPVNGRHISASEHEQWWDRIMEGIEYFDYDAAKALI